jgi:hypothetical protein
MIDDTLNGLDHPESTSTVDITTMARTTVLELAGWNHSHDAARARAQATAVRRLEPLEC